MTLRTSDMYKKGDPELNILMENFMTIATAKVATSVKRSGRIMGLFKDTDKHTLNRTSLLSEAKTRNICFFNEGYTQKKKDKIKVHGRSGLAMFKAGINNETWKIYFRSR